MMYVYTILLGTEDSTEMQSMEACYSRMARQSVGIINLH